MGDCWGGCGGTSDVVLLSTAMLRGLNIVGAILSKAVSRFVDTGVICTDVDVWFVCDGIAGYEDGRASPHVQVFASSRIKSS